LDIKRRLNTFIIALFSLIMLAVTSFLASAEVITYDYDNAGHLPDRFHKSKAVEGFILSDYRKVEVSCR